MRVRPESRHTGRVESCGEQHVRPGKGENAEGENKEEDEEKKEEEGEEEEEDDDDDDGGAIFLTWTRKSLMKTASPTQRAINWSLSNFGTSQALASSNTRGTYACRYQRDVGSDAGVSP